MPQLPIYDSQQKIAVQSTGARTVGSSGMVGTGLQQLGGVVANFGETLERIEDKWAKAKSVNQYTTVKNENQMDVNQLLVDADGEVDHNNMQTYLDRLNEVGGKDVAIDDPNLKTQFNSNNELFLDETRIQIEGMFRQKMIANQRVEIVQDGANTKQNYLDAFSDGKRFSDLEQYKDRLKGYKDSGFISQEEYEIELNDIKDWDYDRALYNAEDNPIGTSNAIDNDEYDVDIKQKNELINTIKASITRREKIREMANLERHSVNEGALSILVREDKTMSIEKKIIKVNELEKDNEISEGYAEDTRRYLKSVQKYDAKTSKADMARSIRDLGNVDGGLASNKDLTNAKEYLMMVRSVRSGLLKYKNMSDEDRTRIHDALNRMMDTSVGEAAEDLKEENRYRKADKYFSETIPAHMRDEALVKFFYRYSSVGRNLSSSKDIKPILERVADEVQFENRNLTKSLFDHAYEKYGLDANLQFSIDEDGNVAVVLFDKTGKGIEVAAEPDDLTRKAK